MLLLKWNQVRWDSYASEFFLFSYYMSQPNVYDQGTENKQPSSQSDAAWYVIRFQLWIHTKVRFFEVFKVV